MKWTSRRAFGAALLLLFTGLAPPGCSHHRRAPSLALEQHSLRLSLSVAPDGTANLAERPPLLGRIELRPILESEGTTPDSVQMLLHAGRYYLWADGFRNVWEITPLPGSTEATYRPVRISQESSSGVRLSHYGSAGSGCVRLDAPGHGVRFISNQGEVHETCP